MAVPGAFGTHSTTPRGPVAHIRPDKLAKIDALRRTSTSKLHCPKARETARRGLELETYQAKVRKYVQRAIAEAHAALEGAATLSANTRPFYWSSKPIQLKQEDGKAMSGT